MGQIPAISADAVFAAVSPAGAIEAVREAFVRHIEGEWQMPSKVYLDASPHGDFRAMPALGDGIAILKWVTSFPGNPAQGRPVVYGTILVSDATTGQPVAIVDGRAVTALRTGAAAAVATAALAREGASTASIVGCGLHGRWALACLEAIGFSEGVCFDRDPSAAERLATEFGWRAGSLADAVGCDVITTVTPGRAVVIGRGDLASGAHVNALGADGSGKAEMDVDEVLRCRLFCDEWNQASHGGELTGAVERGDIGRAEVVELGRVLAGEAPGRKDDAEITLFDSTGLAIQDLAITLRALEAYRDGKVPGNPVSLD